VFGFSGLGTITHRIVSIRFTQTTFVNCFGHAIVYIVSIRSDLAFKVYALCQVAYGVVLHRFLLTFWQGTANHTPKCVIRPSGGAPFSIRLR